MKKKNLHRITAFVLSLVMCITLLPVVAPAAAEAAGYGSNSKFLAPIAAPAAGSIPISNRAELEAIRNNLGGSYHLTADIDLSGAEWAPIGDNSGGSSPKRFSGVFDGQGHVIRNLSITGEGYKYNGLFGYVTGTGIIKNTGMEGTNINITQSSGAAFSGALCAYTSGADISNCYNTGNLSTISAENYNSATGGICGLTEISNTNISYCYNTGRISSSTCAGGICGQSLGNGSTTNIDACFNTGSITAVSIAGGICGNSSSSPTYITNCFNTGSISVDSSQDADKYKKTYAGGIGGYYTQISKCYNAGDMSAAAPLAANAHIGGILGGGYYEPSSDTYWDIDKAQVINGASRNIEEKKGFGGYSETSHACATSQMKTAATFVGFDFSVIWDIDPAVNDGYPFLRNMPDLGGNPGANGEMLLVSNSPASGSSNVLRSNYIELVFSQTINVVVESRVKLIKSSTSQPVAIEIKQYADNPSALRIIPISTLEPNTRYHLEIEGNALAASGNRYFAGISGDQGYYFTTGTDFDASWVDVLFNNGAGQDVVLTVPWSDEYFSGSALEDRAPNMDLAVAALTMSNAIYQGENRIKNTLEAFGFDPAHTKFSDFFIDDHVAYAIGSKKITLDGKTCNVVAIVLRGTIARSLLDVDTITDWVKTLFLPSQTGSLYQAWDGFSRYLEDSGISGYKQRGEEIKILITGHSRGGSVGDLLGHELSEIFGEDRVFGYNFATLTTTNSSAKHLNIHNIVNNNDVADSLLAAITGLSTNRYGGTYRFNSNNSQVKAKFKELTGMDSSQSTVECHSNVLYMAYLLTRQDFSNQAVVKYAAIECPVDIEVYNGNGTLVGRVMDNKVDESIVSEALMWVEGDKKYVFLPSDGVFTFKMAGTDDGVMNYSINSADPDTGALLEQKIFQNVALYKGKQLESIVGGTIAPPDIILSLVSDGKIVGEVLEDGTEIGVRIPFSDVKESDWFYDSVAFCYERGLMNGTTATTFSPDTTLSRAMFATVLYRIEGEPSVTFSNIFNDVPSGQWYSSAIVWAYQNGVISGYGDGRFGTGDNITREQMMTILYNYAVFKGYDTSAADSLSGFTDAGKISSWALDAVNWCVAAKIVNGTTEIALEPGGKSSRAQCATVLRKYLEAEDGWDFITPDRPVSFSNMRTEWDISWGDDQYAVCFSYEASRPVSERGFICWDSGGKEISYIDGPSGGISFSGESPYVYFCVHCINPDGSHYGSLAAGETYYWLAYVICDGIRYESEINSFIFSTSGSRYG